LGCIQNKAILISMSVGRHDRVVLKYWTFFSKEGRGRQLWHPEKKGVQLLTIGRTKSEQILFID